MGYLLKETAEFANCLAERIESSTSRFSLVAASPLSERKAALEFLTALYFHPLASCLEVDPSKLMTLYSNLLRKNDPKRLLTRFMENHILHVLYDTSTTNNAALTEEIFSYLEVASDLPQCLRRFVKDRQTGSDPFNSPGVNLKDLRFMCIVLLRAMNPQSDAELRLDAARKLLSRATKTIPEAAHWVLASSNHAYSRMFERLLRLIAISCPAGVDDVKLELFDGLLSEMEKFDCPDKGYYAISGVRCLLLASWNTDASRHVRFAKILAKWVMAIHKKFSNCTECEKVC